MTPGEPQPAWILHATAYRETSLLVEALTLEAGRVGFIARGVRAARAQPLRAALQPLQPLLISLRGRGELALLASAEVRDGALPLTGQPLLAAFYVNELVMRLLPRNAPSPALFWRYALCLNQLADEAGLAWTLRCFERDLLEALGYGLRLDVDALAGAPIDAEAHYRYEHDRGAIPARKGSADTVSGAALLALAGDDRPPLRLLVELRRLMRAAIACHLGGRELRSWRILAELGRAAALPVSAAQGAQPERTGDP